MSNIVGSIYNGEVVHKDNNSYLMDLGIGFDAILPMEEAEFELEIGDQADVIVAYYVKEDYYVSMKGVSRKKKLDEISELIGTQNTISGKVLEFAHFRFKVDLGNGVLGTVYVKNMDTKFIKEGDAYLNQEYNFLVTGRNNRGREDFDLNRRDIIQLELDKKRTDFNEKYKVDEKFTGIVSEVIGAGVLVDIDGTQCFVPRSEVSHTHGSAMPELGSEVEVLVQEVQQRNMSLKGSIKALLVHPFAQAADLKVGDIIKGKIVRKNDYGLFVEIFENVDGLVHISEVSYEHTKSLNHLEIGQEIDVKVINIDNDKKKIGLSIKRLQPSPFEHLIAKVKVGDTISVLIKRITETGVRVMVMDNFFMTIINEDIYDFSRTKPTFRINDRLEVIVTEISDTEEKITLSNVEFVKKQYEEFESGLSREE